jgi:hypothetical protein
MGQQLTLYFFRMALFRFVCPYCEKPAEVQVTGVTRSRPCPHCEKSVMLQVGGKDSRRRALLVTEQQREPLFSGATGDGSLVRDSLVEEKPELNARGGKRNRQVIFAAASKETSHEQTVANAIPATADEKNPLESSAESVACHSSNTSATPALARHAPVSMSGPAYEPQNLEGDAFERMKMDPEIAVIKKRLRMGVFTVLAMIALLIALNKIVKHRSVDTPTAGKSAVSPVDPSTPMPENAVGLKRSNQTQPNNTELKLDISTLEIGVSSSSNVK